MKTKYILRALIIVFMIRLFFALFPSFQVDMGTWLAWAKRMAELGPSHFYSDTVWTQYTPGFLYWLWIIGKLGLVNPLAIKIPTILADMLVGYLIWKIIRKTDISFANFAFIFYVLSPVAILNGSIWGQIDGILTLFMFLSVFVLLEMKRNYLSWIFASMAFLIKPQAIAIYPLLGIVSLIRFGWKKTIFSILIGGAVIIIGFIPFYPHDTIVGIVNLIQKMGQSYSYTSLFAFNIWSYVGMWKLDSTNFAGLSYFTWGVILSFGAYVAMLWRYRKVQSNNVIIYLMFALSCYIFFLFPTRAHERYLFPMFAYLVTFTGMIKQRIIFFLTGLAVVIYTINLYLSYSYYETVLNPFKNVFWEQSITNMIPVLSAIQIGIFGCLILSPIRENLKEKMPVLRRHRKTVEQWRDKYPGEKAEEEEK